MASDLDIVIQSKGGASFRPFFATGAGIDTTAYERAKKNRNLTRTLLSIGCGADGDLEPNLKELLAEIDKATKQDGGRIGALCLYGTSNGCGLILALAKALQGRAGAPKAIYIGLGDVTMIPFGRSPLVPGIGNLQPTNPPQVSFGLSKARRILSRVGEPPSVSGAPPPLIADPGIVADTRRNFFTVAGNRARVFSLSPAGKDNWWWASTMFAGEVHGEIPGWNNIPRTTLGSTDDAHHFNLCEGIAIPEMKGDIAVELVKFVTNLPSP